MAEKLTQWERTRKRMTHFAHEYLHTVAIYGGAAVFLWNFLPLNWLFQQLQMSRLRAINLVDMHPALFAALTAALLVTILVLATKLVRRRRSERQVYEILGKSAKDHALFQQALAELLKGRVSQSAIDSVDDKIIEYLRTICDDVAAAFSALCRSQCCASIKSFLRSNGEITTYARDRSAASHRRAVADEALTTFNYKKNTAFREILDDDACDFFCSNYLRARHILKYYENDNRRWWKEYSATCVQPISDHIAAERIRPESVVGFLCVDSIRGRFRRDQAKALLSIYSHYVFVALDITAAVE